MNRTLLAAAALAGAALASSAAAQDFKPITKGTFIVDVRVSDVSPDASSAITTAAGAATGLHVTVSDSVMPTLGFTYFLTDHIGLEAILGTTNHEIFAEGTGVKVKVRDTWVLPPVVALQYHFLPGSRFNPYVGAGVNAMLFYGGGNDNGYHVAVKNGVGAALQAGFHYSVSGPWLANVDVKKVFFSTDASINSEALKSNVNLDPWVFSVGLGRRF